MTFKRKKKVSKQPGNSENNLRIIGGHWRGRKIIFSKQKGLRPTLDRVRETLFNWLQADIYDAHCLDLFSGSGALAFEALSRGAKSVDIIENNSCSAQLIEKNLKQLNCDNGQVFLQNAQDFLLQQADAEKRYDIVFLDPPFEQSLLEPICHQLNDLKFLHSESLIYIESEAKLSLTGLPDNWFCYRKKQTKSLNYYLFTI